MNSKQFKQGLFFFLILCFSLYATHEENIEEAVTATEGLPSSLVNQSVCVISGEYVDQAVDVILQGPEPLVISRSYSSMDREGNIGRHWRFNHQEAIWFATKTEISGRNVWCFSLTQPSGSHLYYSCSAPDKKNKLKPQRFALTVPRGLTNCGSGEISGRTNIKNQKAILFPENESELIQITSGSGVLRIYKMLKKNKNGRMLLHQISERKSNGNGLVYHPVPDSYALDSIQAINFNTKAAYSFIKLKRSSVEHKYPCMTLKTSDGRSIKYKFFKHEYKEKATEGACTETNYCLNLYLNEVESPNKPLESYEYCRKQVNSNFFQISSKKQPNHRFLSTEYYKARRYKTPEGETIEINEDDYRLDRVRLQKAPVGTDKTPIVTYQFVYHANSFKVRGFLQILSGYTDVYDAYLHKTTYRYTADHRLEQILKHTGTGPYAVYSVEGFVWGANKSDQESNLLGRYFSDQTGKVYQARYFTYDQNGNILVDSLYGQLTGNGRSDVIFEKNLTPVSNYCECFQKFFFYSNEGLNLLLAEQEMNGKKTCYYYKPGTDQLVGKFICNQDQICIRYYYFYDQNNTLIKTIMDDGRAIDFNDLTDVTQRKITYVYPRMVTPIGLPERVDECFLDLATGQEMLLKRVISTYSTEGRLLRQDCYDSFGNYCYSLGWEYDQRGRVIKEINALGEVVFKQYDENDNLICKIGPRCGYEVRYEYDYCNRLIREEEKEGQAVGLVTTHRYDYLGNRVATLDPYGQETNLYYDEFGRLIKTEYPLAPNEMGQLVRAVTLKQYNAAGQPICEIDAKGQPTFKQYNIRGQPTLVTYPDGTQEKCVYTLDGKLAEKIEKNGKIIRYTHDYQGRLIREDVYDANQQLLKSSLSNYNAFHLISSIDPEGVVTNYQYDGAGRLISTIRGDEITIQSYDSLGRISEVKEWFGSQLNECRISKKSYDALDRVIEERIEESDGGICYLKRYTYDSLGNQVLIQEGELIHRIEYNAFSQPIQLIDPLGQVTHKEYNRQFVNGYQQCVLQVITTDPLGSRVLETYDTANRLAQVERRNPFGMTIACQRVCYDVNGNKIKVIDQELIEGKLIREIGCVWHYNVMNQIVDLLEAVEYPEQKVTHFAYNGCGEKISELKPNGVALVYLYDIEGRLQEFKATDESFHYTYEYNRLNQPTKIYDVKNQCVNERGYSVSGRLIKEKLGNGLETHYQYDRVGRITAVTLPDQTGIEYQYNALDLKEIRRLKNGQKVYSHSNTIHNLSGQVIQSQLIEQGGGIHYEYDQLGRCSHIKSEFLNQLIPPDGYDLAGNLINYWNGSEQVKLAYDDCYQLKAEHGCEEHTYVCDSLSNRWIKDGQMGHVNALNQLIHQGDKRYVYDLNGNLAQCIQENDVTEYVYDALNRLIQVKGQMTVTYLYDSFNRRITRKQEGKGDQHFFYQGLEEVGVWEGEEIRELKVLGHATKSRAIAIEIKDDVYIPLYDLFGNIKVILNQDGQLEETYHYTVFGEEKIFGAHHQELQESLIGNAWRYAGKRQDRETGFVAFGLRYYDPETARWLTPDPIGFEDGPNLYAYLHHNPSIYFDAFGLLGEPTGPNWITPCFGLFGFAVSYLRTSLITGLLSNYENCVSLCPESWHERLLPENYILNGEQNIEVQSQAHFTEPINYSISFTNGVGTTLEAFQSNLTHLASLTDNLQVNGTHTPTHLLLDACRYLDTTFTRINFLTVETLHKKWDALFASMGPKGTILEIPHSWGCALVRNALESYPEDLRKRIEVVAIAPGAYIDENLCGRVVHYVSTGDIVPYFDIMGRIRCRDTTIHLTPHEDAFFLDHFFTSPTYVNPIKYRINEYVDRQKKL